MRSSAMTTGTELLEALPVAVYTTDAEGRITFYNQAAADLWGHHPELGSSQWCGSWRLYWPDGRPLPHGECPMAVALKEGRQVRGLEAIAERPDGTRVRFPSLPDAATRRLRATRWRYQPVDGYNRAARSEHGIGATGVDCCLIRRRDYQQDPRWPHHLMECQRNAHLWLPRERDDWSTDHSHYPT